MALVDLRGREHEPEVSALIEADPAWSLVGWSRDGALVACAAFERLSEEEVAVRAVAQRDHDAARSLLRAVAEVATASRLVADVDGRDGVLEAAGFVPYGSAAGRLVLVLTEAPATPDAVGATSLGEIEAAIREAWGRDTSDDPDEWSRENPARGQCTVSALVLRELLGGDILVANVLRDGRRVDRHAWNRLPSGVTVDLTREQFRNGERLGEPRVEEPLLTHRNPERLATLRERVRARLGLEA
jgi:hypothetical protein